jgi:hypothetical protein
MTVIRYHTICIPKTIEGASWPWSYGSWIYNYLCNQCLSPLMLWVWISMRVRCTTLCDKVCQWLATGQWFSLGPSISSTDKTDRHDIAINAIKQTNQKQSLPWCNGHLMLTSSVVDLRFDPRSCHKLKTIKLVFLLCFSAKHRNKD